MMHKQKFGYRIVVHKKKEFIIMKIEEHTKNCPNYDPNWSNSIFFLYKPLLTQTENVSTKWFEWMNFLTWSKTFEICFDKYLSLRCGWKDFLLLWLCNNCDLQYPSQASICKHNKSVRINFSIKNQSCKMGSD